MFLRKKSNDAPRRRTAQAGDARREMIEKQRAAQETDKSVFRRNRTMTGSLSSRVGSANEHNTDLKSPRTHAHTLTKQRRKLSGALGVTFGVCLVLALVLIQFTARPVVLAADGAVSLDTGRYEKVIDEYLSRHPVERLRFVLNTDRLNEYLQRHLPEVVTAQVEGPAGFGSSNFAVTVRQPVVSWMIDDSQYFVDAEGVSFQKNYYDIPAVRIVDESGVQQSAGTAIASSRFLNFVGRAVSLAKDKGLTVEEAIIPLDTTRQIALKVSGHDYPIKLSLDRSVGEQVEDMQYVIAHFDEKKIKPQYVDVRVAGKAFYK